MQAGGSRLPCSPRAPNRRPRSATTSHPRSRGCRRNRRVGRRERPRRYCTRVRRARRAADVAIPRGPDVVRLRAGASGRRQRPLLAGCAVGEGGWGALDRCRAREQGTVCPGKSIADRRSSSGLPPIPTAPVIAIGGVRPEHVSRLRRCRRRRGCGDPRRVGREHAGEAVIDYLSAHGAPGGRSMTEDTGHQSGPATATRGGVTDARVAAAEICADLRGGDLLDSSFERRVGGSTRATAAGRRSWCTACCAAARGSTRRCRRARARRRGAPRSRPHRHPPAGRLPALFMGSVPPYAAIAQTVELAKRRHGIGASKLANAVLRRVDRERETISSAGATRGADPRRRDRRLAALAPALARGALGRPLGSRRDAALLEANNAEAPLIVRPYRRRARAARGDARERRRTRRGRSARARQHSRHRRVVADRARRVPAGAVLRAGSRRRRS